MVSNFRVLWLAAQYFFNYQLLKNHLVPTNHMGLIGWKILGYVNIYEVRYFTYECKIPGNILVYPDKGTPAENIYYVYMGRSNTKWNNYMKNWSWNWSAFQVCPGGLVGVLMWYSTSHFYHRRFEPSQQDRKVWHIQIDLSLRQWMT